MAAHEYGALTSTGGDFAEKCKELCDKISGITGTALDTTRAQGEGALEGTIGDYQLQDWSHTAFAFSRFDARGRTAPRNASALG